jgi:putative peptide zinc metalloprotease protein
MASTAELAGPQPAEPDGRAAINKALLLKRASRLDEAGSAQSIVCELTNGSCLRMSPSAYWLYRELQAGRTAPEIAARIEDRFGQQVAAKDVEQASAELLDRVRDESQVVTATARRRYVFRLRLVPEPVVGRVAARLTAFLSAPALAVWIGLVSASAVWFWTASLSALGAGRINLGTSILIGYLIYLTTLIAHELGHAAACVRYGVSPGDIGFAIYLVFPAIYCDATRAWLLPRRQRLMVDAAGVMFEVGLGAVFSDLGIALHQASLVIAAMMVLGNLLIVLNPLGRFDSYWMLSDALGITDLSRQRSQLLRRMFGRRRDSDADPASYRGLYRGFIAAYSALTILVIAWFAYSAARFSGPFFAHLNSGMAAIGADFEAGRLGGALARLAGIVPGLVVLGVIFYRLARMVPSLLARSRRRSREAA